MPAWIILAVLVAVLFAAVHGVRAAGRSIRDRYRAKRALARDFVAAGIAPNAASRGRRFGMAVAATVTGPGVTLRAFLDAWRWGWLRGKRWTAIQRGRRRRRRIATAAGTPPPATSRATVRPDRPVGVPVYCLHFDPHTGHCNKPAAPASAYCPTHRAEHTKPAGRPATTPAGGTRPMPIETKTSGEIHTKEQFENELNATIAEATAELEAANADLQAATEDVGRVENMVASLERCEIDAATRQKVMALAATNAATQAAHRARVTAAEQRLAAAQQALETFKSAAQTKFHANAS